MSTGFLAPSELAGRGTIDMDNLTSKMDTARAYAQRGWAVFPVYSIKEDGSCSCGNTSCRSPGKHPMTPTGHKEATHDPEQIESWWSQWPDANIGIATGEISGLLVLDIDDKNGGFDSLTKIEDQYGSLPETLRVSTGGGGLHYYFSVPNGQRFRNSAGKIAN